jgi:hypothetical protein
MWNVFGSLPRSFGHSHELFKLEANGYVHISILCVHVQPDFICAVPALLKHWKRLQSGLELSAEAFLNLSKRFKEQSKTWLAEDTVAQGTRHNNPDAMDIYDTSHSHGMGNISLTHLILFI